MKKLLLAAGCLATVFGASAEKIPNPVIPNVADIGVMRYNGKYYLGGCRTDGDFYISDDLTNWEGPIHVIDMDNEWSKGSGCGNNQIHANDMLYDNGTVHAYWSVNYWGNDKHAVHVVHSEASDPMGPYAEPVRDRWMDNRIDPKVFRDDDGQLYMYMVRFTDGNTIWARKMKNWREFVDETEPDAIICQFASNPNTWERMDNAVAEGPWVIKYHGKYYMMYNANHTGGEWGNYQLGVAQATHPMGFNNGNKYSHPVVLSNQKALEDNNTELLRYSTGTYAPMFSYNTNPVPADWTKPEFKDANWAKGSGGFAPSQERGSTTYRRGTMWNTDTLRLRKSFNVTDLNRNLAMRLTSKGPVKVWLNGTPIHTEEHGVYRIVNFTPEMKRALKIGGNVLAIETEKPQRGQGYFNVELFDMGNQTADPEIVWTPGQPNILRGPNGLEWWLIYMANDNGIGRSQFVDRVHFHGDKMVVDGITHRNNAGHHPTPALPAYGDRFDNADQLANFRFPNQSAWQVTDGELRNNAAATATLVETLASPSYLWEVNVKPNETAGVYAAYIHEGHNVKVLFNKEKNSWDVIETIGGEPRVIASTPLRDDFRWDVYHQIRLERDLADLIVSIDEMRVAEPFETSITAAAVPGLVADAPAAFDGVVYTIGFDDGNDRMNGWDVKEGALILNGSTATATDVTRAFKGVPARNYEFTTQVSNIADKDVAGFYPLYVDDNNYVKAVIDAPQKSLVVTTMRKGKMVDSRRIPLDCMRTLYTDQRFTDSFDKGYTFDCPTEFDAIYLKRYDVANRNVFTDNRFDKDTPTVGEREIFVENMFDLVEPAYVAPDGSWKAIDTSSVTVDENPIYNVATFDPITASRFRFINTNPTDGGYHIYDIRVHELFKNSYNLRAERVGDELLIFVDGEEKASLPVKDFAESVVGLAVEGELPEFSGVTYFHK